MAAIVSNDGSIILNGQVSIPREKFSAKVRLKVVEVTGLNGVSFRVKPGDTVDGVASTSLSDLLSKISALNLVPAAPVGE